jgi:hypothetical protein
MTKDCNKLTKFLIVSFILFIAFTTASSGQYTNPFLRPRNNVSLNLFGDASVIAANYDHLFLTYHKFFLSTKVGLGYSESRGLPADNTLLFSFPMHVTGNYGQKYHYFEFGFGGTLLFYGKFTFWDYAVFPILGYRYQPLKSDRVMLRLYATYPLTDKIDIDNYWFCPVGFTIGFCFK